MPTPTIVQSLTSLGPLQGPVAHCPLWRWFAWPFERGVLILDTLKVRIRTFPVMPGKNELVSINSWGSWAIGRETSVISSVEQWEVEIGSWDQGSQKFLVWNPPLGDGLVDKVYISWFLSPQCPKLFFDQIFLYPARAQVRDSRLCWKMDRYFWVPRSAKLGPHEGPRAGGPSLDLPTGGHVRLGEVALPVLADQVQEHFWTRLGGVIFVSKLADGWSVDAFSPGGVYLFQIRFASQPQGLAEDLVGNLWFVDQDAAVLCCVPCHVQEK